MALWYKTDIKDAIKTRQITAVKRNSSIFGRPTELGFIDLNEEMLWCIQYICLLVLICSARGNSLDDGIRYDDDANLRAQIEEMKKNQRSLQQTIGSVSRQLMLQQLFVEERIRSEGHSGIKQVRVYGMGDRPYRTSTHTGGSIASIHDHANNQRTVGMGEYIAVLNGVEFRTRHNDYRLYMPHRTDPRYGKFEPIPFPPVPPEVTSLKTTEEQIVEMREWFKAWRDQDTSKRDYRKYFRPVLCYLEGAWTNPNTQGDIDEPFPSDRHFVDAKNWFELQEKIRFTSYSGRKSNFENYAYLPTTIMNVTRGTTPVFAQWNYRIMCHPIKDDLPTNRFRVVDEFGRRMRYRWTVHDLTWQRQARFQLNMKDDDRWHSYAPRGEYGLLDKIMAEIPGKDNYPGDLVDDAFDLPAVKLDGTSAADKINAAYYNRAFRVTRRGAMGLSNRHRGFSDENLFMAMTTQPKVAGMDLNDCKYVQRKQVCKLYSQKWTYAIPLEIIYLTPLSKWNPYDIQFKGHPSSKSGREVVEGGKRNGATPEKAYNGTSETVFYQTPMAFFNGDISGKDPADTASSAVWVLNKAGKPQQTKASGMRIFLPSIPGVGVLRQRYPVMPVHGEGSSVWKELSAISDALLDSHNHLALYRQSLNTKPLPTLPPIQRVIFKTGISTSDKTSKHTHDIVLEDYQIADLQKNLKVTVTTGEANGHEHKVVISYQKQRNYYYISICDGRTSKWPYRCWDKHFARMNIVEA